MSDQPNTVKANEIFSVVCKALEEMNIRYRKAEDINYKVVFNVPSKDIPIRVVIIVDVANEQVALSSRVPINITTDKYFEMALAVNAANLDGKYGCFALNCESGNLIFRMSNTYKDSTISTEVYKYMIDYARETVDLYNDKFLKVARDLISLREFLKEEL